MVPPAMSFYIVCGALQRVMNRRRYDVVFPYVKSDLADGGLQPRQRCVQTVGGVAHGLQITSLTDGRGRILPTVYTAHVGPRRRCIQRRFQAVDGLATPPTSWTLFFSRQFHHFVPPGCQILGGGGGDVFLKSRTYIARGMTF